MATSRFVARSAYFIFSYRKLLLVLFAIVTVLLGWSATHLKADAGFSKTIPTSHPYMQTLLKFQNTFGGANTVLIAVMQEHGDIFTTAFLKDLKGVTNDLFFVNGVKRESVASLWTPNVRYVEITEQGFNGGAVIKSGFQGTPEELRKIRSNLEKSGQIGQLASNDLRGAIVRAELLDIDPATGKALDYEQVAKELEQIRARYQHDGRTVHIIGFAKAVGEISDGARGVCMFFAVAFSITLLLLFLYTRSWSVTALAAACAALPVIWLLGILPLINVGLDPMSILIPYLIFTIGVSHAVQMTSAWQAARRSGLSPKMAANSAFLQLFVPGALALLTNALGFMVIMMIDIPMVRELGMTASIGVALMLLTNKVFLPIVLSYAKVPVSPGRPANSMEGIRRWCATTASGRKNIAVIAIAMLLGVVGAYKGHQLRIGDPGKGIPELAENSVYNQDNAAIVNAFSIGVDQLSVIAKGRLGDKSCLNTDVANYISRFERKLSDTDGVQSVIAYPGIAAMVNSGWNEGSLKWYVLPDDPQVLSQTVNQLITDNTGLISRDCEAMQIMIFTKDHSGATIAHIVSEIEAFKAASNSAGVELLLASGNVGVMAAVNQAVAAAEPRMLISIFAALALLCLATFREWLGPLVILLPLALVSLLCNALMATFDVGLKVSTLPVVTLGVGVGVDYGIYLYEAMKHRWREGASFDSALEHALKERGPSIVFTAVTMSVGVGSWYFSALKFQADMGLLLAFMFIVNAIGAILLMPALASRLIKRKKPVKRESYVIG
jgi:predicted RND superfamily exporter protein